MNQNIEYIKKFIDQKELEIKKKNSKNRSFKSIIAANKIKK